MEIKEKKMKKCLMEGAISAEFIAKSIAGHQSKTGIGAHTIFLGQVRADDMNGKTVTAIEYSAYSEMAEKEFHRIREEAFAKFDLTCLHVYHSTGRVKSGEISLFVMVSSKHRKESLKAQEFLVEEIKHAVPIWKKEIFKDGSENWVDGLPKD